MRLSQSGLGSEIFGLANGSEPDRILHSRKFQHGRCNIADHHDAVTDGLSAHDARAADNRRYFAGSPYLMWRTPMISVRSPQLTAVG